MPWALSSEQEWVNAKLMKEEPEARLMSQQPQNTLPLSLSLSCSTSETSTRELQEEVCLLLTDKRL